MNSKVSLGFWGWKGLNSHQVQSSAFRLDHRLPTAPKNQIPHEPSTTRHWKVLPLIWPKSRLLHLAVPAQVLPLRVALTPSVLLLVIHDHSNLVPTLAKGKPYPRPPKAIPQ